MAHFLLILLISRISCSQGIWGYLIFFTFRRQIIFLQKLKEIFLCPFKCFFSWYFCQVNNIQFLLFFSRSPLPLATFQPLYPKKEEKKNKKENLRLKNTGKGSCKYRANLNAIKDNEDLLLLVTFPSFCI